jgi:hypothetical protein
MGVRYMKTPWTIFTISLSTYKYSKIKCLFKKKIKPKEVKGGIEDFGKKESKKEKGR